MVNYIIAIGVVSMLAGVGYTVFIAPKRWMKMMGENGCENPLRRAYANAGADNVRRYYDPKRNS